MDKAVVYRTGIVVAVFAVFAVFATAPALAHVDVYFSPEPNTLDLDVGENVTVQVIADLDSNETYGIKVAQVGIDFNPNVVNITDAECPCKLKYGPYCVEWWWNKDDFSGVNYPDPGDPYAYGRFEWLFTSDNVGHDAPITIPLANITIERVAPGDMYLDISPLEFTHEIRYLPSCPLSRLFDKNNDNIDETRITWHDIFERRLYKGWNLISLPFVPEDNSTASVLASVWDNVSGPVYRYNATTKEFESVTTMEPGVGYFVYLTADDIWRYSGTKKYGYSPTSFYPGGIEMKIHLEPGLNLIGAPCWPIELSDDVITSGDHWYVTTFNATAQKYTDSYNPVAPAVFNRLTEMEPGAGYWVSAKHECWLNVTVNQ